MNIEEFVNVYLVEHRHDVLLNPYRGLVDFAEALKGVMAKEAVDGRYMKAYSKVYVESWPLDIEPDSVKAGDEVRLIVIPEKREKVK